VARFVWIFLDGVGLAPAGPANPLSTVPTPALAGILGAPLVLEACRVEPEHVLVPLDACLGIPGLPQSATGQTTLFTGENAAALVGRHVTAFPGPSLAALLAERSILRRAVEAGFEATFANPFTPGYFAAVAAGERRHSATTLAALASGRPLRGREELLAGRAVSYDVERDLLAARAGVDVPRVSAAQAGRDLAAVAREADLVLWETFLTDLAGHLKRGVAPEEAIRRVDGLLGGLAGHLPADATVVLTSDHGNLEDLSTPVHTRNPVPLLAFGRDAEAFADLSSIAEVGPRILARLAQGASPASS